MGGRAKQTIGQNAASLIVVVIVFGLAMLMVLERYDPAVITTVVAGVALAAAGLVRLLRELPSTRSKSDRARKTGP
jgi:hypothetical protein